MPKFHLYLEKRVSAVVTVEAETIQGALWQRSEAARYASSAASVQRDGIGEWELRGVSDEAGNDLPVPTSGGQVDDTTREVAALLTERGVHVTPEVLGRFLPDFLGAVVAAQVVENRKADR